MIERLLPSYMTQAEIVATLQEHHVDPQVTLMVWCRLEDQNPDFFYAYAVMLRVKDQIAAFNYLVEQQERLLSQVSMTMTSPVQGT